MDRLQEISKVYSPLPGLTIWMLPYLPGIWETHSKLFYAHLEELGEERSNMHTLFIMTVPLITGIEITGKLPAWVNALHQAYQLFRGYGVVPCWDMFAQVSTNDMINVLWAVYENTRDDLPTAPAILQQSMPVPEDDEGNENRVYGRKWQSCLIN